MRPENKLLIMLIVLALFIYGPQLGCEIEQGARQFFHQIDYYRARMK